MSWQTQINGLENLSPELMAIAHEGIFLGMEKIGVEGSRMVQTNIATPYNGIPAAVFTGNLAGSVQSQVTDEQAMIRLVIGVGQAKGADRYAAPVETGARPHFPPPSALLLWVKRKFDISDEGKARSAAYVVARAIARRGTRGHEMFLRALEQLEPMAAPILEREIAMAFARAGFGAEA